MSGETVTEWGIDYRDGCPIIAAPDEYMARRWVEHWNLHREDNEPCVLMTRTVTTTPWQPTTNRTTQALRECAGEAEEASE